MRSARWRTCWESLHEPEVAAIRLAPVPMYFAGNPFEAIEKSGESSRTTHGATAAVDAWRYFGGLIIGALQGESKEILLSDHYCPVAEYWQKRPLAKEIAEIASGSFKRKNPREIQGTGYVVKSLEAALWAFYRSESFKEGCLMAVNLGDDADTTGAVYGQLAGACCGLNGILEPWVSKLAKKDLILSIADRLFALRRHSQWRK